MPEVVSQNVGCSAHIHIPEGSTCQVLKTKGGAAHIIVLEGSTKSFSCHNLEGSGHILLVTKDSTHL